MRMNDAYRRLVLAAAVLGLTLSAVPGCGPCGGTETGNCDPALTGSTDGAMTPTRPAVELRNALCSKLAECHTELAVTDCQLGLNAVANIDTEIGVAGGTYATYEDLIDDEAAGNLTGDATILDVCTADIAALTCSNPLVQGAWSSGDSTNFSNVETMIPTTAGSCPDVY